jgi:NTP pyrophosphatase (non-canonical NTP hydrolase)
LWAFLLVNEYLVNLEANKNLMSEILEITNALIKFRDDRNWEQFHDSKNLATAISIEAAELNELFLWKTIKESEEVDLEKMKEELADVFAFALLLANKHKLDVRKIILDKIEKNSTKYPISKAKGTAKKYNEL